MANACKITSREIKKGLTDKGIKIAQSVDSTFTVSSIGELVLPLDSSSTAKNEPYKLRRIVDRTVNKLNKELSMDPNKFGFVFGGVTYTDSAAIQILVTPQLFASYQVKNEEKTIEEVFPVERTPTPTYAQETAYRPTGFYKNDYALMEQELKDLESLEEAFAPSTTSIEFTEDIKSTYVPPSTPVQLELDLRLSKEQPPQKGDLGSIGFEEIACDV